MFWLNLPEGVDGPSRVQLLQLSSQGRDKLQLLIPLVLQTHNSMPPAIHLQLDTRRVLLLPYTVQYVQFPIQYSRNSHDPRESLWMVKDEQFDPKINA